jgi:hypothetical protein
MEASNGGRLDTACLFASSSALLIEPCMAVVVIWFGRQGIVKRVVVWVVGGEAELILRDIRVTGQ